MAEEMGGVSSYGVAATASVNDSQLINKRAKLSRNSEEEEDRLSALPDPLVLHILSFLDTKDVAKTGVLSRRWQYLWTDLAQFEFRNYSQEIDKIRGFVDWVSKTLVICSGNYLKKFGVLFYYKDWFASSVNVWVQFLIKNKVKDVTLHLLSNNKEVYKLPQLMYSNSSLTKFNLRRCIVAPPGSIRWGSLTSLSIMEVELSRSVMRVILSGCPVLRSLKLAYCWGSRFFDIYTQSLEELVIDNWIDNSDLPLLGICAPYIQTLWFTGCFRGTKCPNFRFIGSSSLVRANLGFYEYFSPSLYSEASIENVMNYVRALLGNLKDVEELVLSAWFIKVLSELKMMGWKVPQLQCKCLILYAFGHGESISGIPCMLESSPDLETLVINLTSLPTYKAHAAFDLNCHLLKLKNVTFKNFGGPYAAGDPILKLVRLLLKKAMILENMVIDVKEGAGSSSSTGNSSDYLKIAQTVLRYPRSSPKAMVQFCY